MKKFLATVVSYVFHPIWLVPLMAAYLIYADPILYLGIRPKDKLFALLSTVIIMVVFPLISVLLARALGFISSIQMKEAKDRIIPYIVTLTCYFWAWRVFQYKESPEPMVAMIFGVFLSASAGLVLNSFLKISMHTMGVGGLVAFMVLCVYHDGGAYAPLFLALAFLIAGLVWTARLIVSNHTTTELVLGFAVGVAGQLLGFAFFH